MAKEMHPDKNQDDPDANSKFSVNRSLYCKLS